MNAYLIMTACLDYTILVLMLIQTGNERLTYFLDDLVSDISVSDLCRSWGRRRGSLLYLIRWLSDSVTRVIWVNLVVLPSNLGRFNGKWLLSVSTSGIRLCAVKIEPTSTVTVTLVNVALSENHSVIPPCFPLLLFFPDFSLLPSLCVFHIFCLRTFSTFDWPLINIH